MQGHDEAGNRQDVSPIQHVLTPCQTWTMRVTGALCRPCQVIESSAIAYVGSPRLTWRK